MFHDLNVCVSPQDEVEAARVAARLGYDVIALTATVRARKLGPEHTPRPRPTADFIETSDGGPLRMGGKRKLRVLRRITLIIEDASQLVVLSSTALTKWDLVAIAPTSEKLFQQCLQFDFDIIALDFAKKQQFYLKRPQLHVAVERGIVFEISYAGALGDSQARRFLIGNACSVARVTMGKQTIISSGATDSMQLRGPHDVINLGHIFGIGVEQAQNAVRRTAEDTVTHGDVRANTHKGIVREVQLNPSTVAFGDMMNDL